MPSEKTYIAIDLKSFYASAECVDRGLNALTTHLVVADSSRTEKTICLAVSPSLKAYGISGRARLFEVMQTVQKINEQRRTQAPDHRFTGKSHQDLEVKSHPELALDYIVAPPRMAHYIEVSSRIYEIYLKYVAPEDMLVYSIDEVFIDATDYLRTYGISAHQLAMKIIRDVLATTGITATAGIGSNLFLCKVAMDIEAKHQQADQDGVRIAELDEQTYREKLWSHQPLTDFWRVGCGIAEKLAGYGIRTMGDIALQSVRNEELLYQLFGVNAELLIDHAWGWEPCTIADAKAYRPETNSFSNGQVLHEAYTFEKARVVIKEMAEASSLQLLDKHLTTDQIVLTVGYDAENMTRPEIRSSYRGPVIMDHYGRKVPKHAHGTINLDRPTSSNMLIQKAVLKVFDQIVNRHLLIRRLNLCTNHVVNENEKPAEKMVQLELFSDYEQTQKEENAQKELLEKERKVQETVLKIKKKFGKNAILKGTNFDEGATMMDRNKQIGGHKA